MNILNYLTGTAKEAADVIGKGPKPTELELSLRQMHADHLAAMQAIKLLTDAVKSNAAGNLDMVVVHEERHKDVLKNMRELKKEVMHSNSQHFAAFELAQRPVLRAIDLVVDKVNGLNADIHGLKVDRHDELDAHTYVLNQKLTLVAERLDRLCRILLSEKTEGLIKHPEGVTVAPAKKKPGRRSGDKNRTPEERYKFLSHRLQVARPNSKSRAKFLFQLVELRKKMGMAPMSDRALGKDAK